MSDDWGELDRLTTSVIRLADATVFFHLDLEEEPVNSGSSTPALAVPQPRATARAKWQGEDEDDEQVRPRPRLVQSNLVLVWSVPLSVDD